MILPGVGGTLASPDRRLQVEIPAGAVDQPLEARFDLKSPLALSPDLQLFYRFELTAWPAGQPESPAPAFLRPVTLTLAYQDSDIEELQEESLKLVTFDPVQGAWTPISATLNVTDHQLTAQLSHFSGYAAEGENGTFFLPRLDAGQVSQFTGASSFSYDLEMPAGAGGMKVPLTLRYSSDIPNGMAHGPYSDDNSDTGWVGIGWTLEIGKIEDGSLTMNGLSGNLQMIDPHLGSDVLEQQCDWDNTHCGWGWRVTRRHRMQDEQFAYITSTFWNSCRTAAECNNIPPPDEADRIENMGQFDVWTKDGVHYIFGSQEYNSVTGIGSRLDVTGNDGHRVYETYLLDTIIDPHGNRIDIEWKVWPKTISGKAHLKEAYPSHIRYTTNSTASPLDTNAEYDVEFIVGAKDYDTKCPNLPAGDCRNLAFTGRILNAISVWYQRPGYARQSVRRYEFGYYNSNSPQYYRLDRITQLNQQGGAALPAFTFTYQNQSIGWAWDMAPDDPGWVERDEVDRPFLWTANNGYGGVATFGYQRWCLSNNPVVEDVNCTSGSWWQKRYRVSSEQVSPGGNGTAMPATYDYDGPAYTLKDEGEVPVKAFLGFQWAWEDAANGQRRTETEFYNTMYADGPGQPVVAHPNDPKKGKPLQVKSGKCLQATGGLCTSQNWQEYTHTLSTYAEYDHAAAGEPNWPADVHFVYLSQTIERTCDSTGACQSKKTKYYYNRKWQNCGGSGWQYGDVTHVEEYDSESAGTPVRTRLTAYCPNVTAWIVDRQALDNLYSGSINPDSLTYSPSNTQLQSATWYSYSDNQDTPTPYWGQTAGNKGELRGVRRMARWNPSYQFSDTRYRHDAYGNVTQETVYNSYGTDAAWASTGARTTTTVYDSDHHTFPVQVTNPLLPPSYTRNYGVNDGAGDGITGSGLPGQVKGTQDPNGVWTWLAYDTFGRKTKEVRPYDTESSATKEYWYADGYSYGGFQGGKVTELLREQNGGDVQVNFDFYDGLGRAVETLTERTNGAAQVLAYTTYDALGQVARKYVPYVVNTDFWEYKPVDAAQPGTITLYDSLGRTTEVVQPDGSTSTSAYAGALTIVVDANGHRRDSKTDALGRLINVYEYLGEPQVYEAEGPELYHLIGSASGGAWLSPPANPQNPNYLTYGPYDTPAAVGTGQVVRFRLAIDIVTGNDDAVAQIEVYDFTAAQIIARRDVRRSQFTGGLGNFSDFQLLFDTTTRSGHQLEYRVYWYGKAQMAHDRTSVVWKGSSSTTSYGYDETDRLEQVIDAANNVSTMSYDLLGHKTGMHDPDMGDWTYGYDALGNLTSQLDAKGQSILFTYDELNRLTLKDLPAGTDEHYYYDEAGHGSSVGRRTRMTDASGNTAWNYDQRGRVTQEQKVIAGAGGGTFVTQWSYDAMDRVTWIKYPADNAGGIGEQVTSTYNPQALVASVSGSSTYVQSTQYDAQGRVELRTLGNSVQTDYVYYPWNQANGQGRVQEIKSGTTLNPPTLQHLIYSYDAVGNVQSIQDPLVTGGTQTQSFTYDGLDRLLNASAAGGSAGQGQYNSTTTYDGIGNLTSKDGTAYTYPASGAGSVQPHAVRRVNVTGGTAKTVQIRAYSTPCNDGVGATMELWVNGGKAQTWTNVAATWTTYQQSVVLSGSNQVEVVFTNDCAAGGYDRNLYVDYVVIDGQTVQAEGPAVIDWGSGTAAFDGLNVVAGQQALTSNGALRLVKGSKAVAACYDANGNMTCRLRDGSAYLQAWDVENRLVEVRENGAVVATYVYDGDGTRVKATVDGTTTAYVGNYLEWTGSAATMVKYYYAGGARVAMRQGSAVYYLLGDQLGSTALTVDSAATKTAELRCKAYGATRYTSGTPPTDYLFTGQRIDSSTGLYQMGDRW